MQVITKIVFAVLAVVMLVVVLSLLIQVKDTDTATVKFTCRNSNMIRSKLGFISKAVSTVKRTPSGFCKGEYVQIYAEDWDKCDPTFKEESLRGDATEAARKCAAQQVAQKIYDCWWMGGEGAWQPGSWICYAGEIHLESKDYKEGELKKGYEKELKQKLGAGYGELASELAVLLETKQIASALIDYYQDVIYIDVANCSKAADASQLDDAVDRLVHRDIDIDKTISDSLLDEYSDPTLKAELVSKLASLYPNKATVERELQGKVKSGTAAQLASEICQSREQKVESLLKDVVDYSKPGCGDLNKQVSANLKLIDGENTKINNAAAQIAKAVSSYVSTHNPNKSGEEISNIVSSLSEIAMKVGAELPAIASFDKEYLYKLMKETSILWEERTYADSIDEEKLAFLNEYEFKVNSKFEIGFCDPPVKLFSGIVAQETCSILKGQQIQVAAAGGGAAGQLRGGSPYPTYCNLATMKVIPERARNLCKSLVKGAARTFGPGTINR